MEVILMSATHVELMYLVSSVHAVPNEVQLIS